MPQDLILAERDQAVLKVVLNRPEKANALTREMLQHLTELFNLASEDDELRVLTIEGAGGRVFCGGADLGQFIETGEAGDDKLWEQLSEALSSVPFLTIAKINGACIGGSLTLALGCDIRLAVPEAVFGYPVLRNGVFPTQQDGRRLEALIGPGRKSLFLLGGCRVEAGEALRWGLVDKVVSAEQLDSAAGELSEAALVSPPGHLEALKAYCQETSG
ncbi:MAG: enoyl-CoA hydratase/isomerase family protein [Alphaproteobacteria bacterium]|nr:enoyl-CoA hydratase/isomerase family protein [Alphaproteobacteria bacterium]